MAEGQQVRQVGGGAAAVAGSAGEEAQREGPRATQRCAGAGRAAGRGDAEQPEQQPPGRCQRVLCHRRVDLPVWGQRIVVRLRSDIGAATGNTSHRG